MSHGLASTPGSAVQPASARSTTASCSTGSNGSTIAVAGPTGRAAFTPSCDMAASGSVAKGSSGSCGAARCRGSSGASADARRSGCQASAAPPTWSSATSDRRRPTGSGSPTYLRPDVGGLALPGGGDRLLLAPGGRLVARRPPARRAGRRRPRDGRSSAPSGRWARPSLRPGLAARTQPVLATACP